MSPSPASSLGGLRADLVEADRDVVAPELVAQRVGALVAVLADHPHRLEADAPGEVPVVEGVGDRAVELLVAPALGTQEDELGVPWATAANTSPVLAKSPQITTTARLADGCSG